MQHPREVTLAAREALVALADPEADTAAVRAKVLELHPHLKSAVANIKVFGASVSRSRAWARENRGLPTTAPMKVTVRAKASRNGHLPTSYERYQTAQRFWQLCGGNDAHTREVVGFLEKQSPAQLREAVEAWLRLVATAGSVERANQVLATMKDTGMM